MGGITLKKQDNSVKIEKLFNAFQYVLIECMGNLSDIHRAIQDMDIHSSKVGLFLIEENLENIKNIIDTITDIESDNLDSDDNLESSSSSSSSSEDNEKVD